MAKLLVAGTVVAKSMGAGILALPFPPVTTPVQLLDPCEPQLSHLLSGDTNSAACVSFLWLR